jgi:Uma2 family endonuclease
VARTGQTMTVDEFLALGEAPFKYWLVEGQLVVNEPKLPHQIAVGQILVALANWVQAAPGRGHAGMPADFILDDHNVYAPDVWWVREERKPRPGDLDLDGLPDIVVEVRSPSTWRYDLGAKRAHYEASGIAELWLVDTGNHTVTAHRRSVPGGPAYDVVDVLGGDDRLTSPLLPGFGAVVAGLFVP